MDSPMMVAEREAVELARYNTAFAEGERGEIELDLDRPLSTDELTSLRVRLDGKAFKVLKISQDDQTVTIRFEAGIFWLPLIALALGAMGTGIVGWRLFKIPTEQLLDTVKRIALPLGGMMMGAVTMAMTGRSWPGLAAGTALMGGSFYLAWRELKPAPPEPGPVLERVKWIGGELK